MLDLSLEKMAAAVHLVSVLGTTDVVYYLYISTSELSHVKSTPAFTSISWETQLSGKHLPLLRVVMTECVLRTLWVPRCCHIRGAGSYLHDLPLSRPLFLQSMTSTKTSSRRLRTLEVAMPFTV